MIKISSPHLYFIVHLQFCRQGLSGGKAPGNAGTKMDKNRAAYHQQFIAAHRFYAGFSRFMVVSRLRLDYR